MSDAEVMAAYAQHVQIVLVLAGTLITFVSAYLVATYLASRRLNWAQFAFLSIMFCIVSLDLATGMYIHGETLLSLALELKQRTVDADSSISFLVVPEAGFYSSRGAAIFWAVAIFSSVAFSAHHKYRMTHL